MAKTIKITKAQERALIWAINIFEMSSYGTEDEELQAEYDKGIATLRPVYDQLED